MPTTGSAKLPYPNSSDPVDVAGDILDLDQRLALMNGAGIASVADATARAALVTNGDAYDGLYVAQLSDHTLWQYQTTTWVQIYPRQLLWERTTNKSLANGSHTSPVAVDALDSTALVNSLGVKLTTTNTASTGQIVCATACTLMVDVEGEFAANATGYRTLSIQKALAASPTVFTAVRTGTETPAGSTWPVPVRVKTSVTLAVGDILQIFAGQNSGGALNLSYLTIDIKPVA